MIVADMIHVVATSTDVGAVYRTQGSPGWLSVLTVAHVGCTSCIMQHWCALEILTIISTPI